MKIEFKKQYTITTGMFDEHMRIKPYAILDIFQDIAGIHADNIGIGNKFCDENNYGWIMARMKVIIHKSPYQHQDVIVHTYPLEPKSKIEFYRQYEMTSMEGEPLISAVALWVIFDFTTGRIVAKPDVYPQGEFVESSWFSGRIEKPINAANVGELCLKHIVAKTDLDIYHHMNNAKYGELIFNAMEESAGCIRGFVINYQNQAHLNDEIDIYKFKEDNILHISGITDGKVIFSSNIEIGEYK